MTETTTLSAIETTTVGIYISREMPGSDCSDVGIILEGLVVLQDLDNVALATAMLFGLFLRTEHEVSATAPLHVRSAAKGGNGVRCDPTLKESTNPEIQNAPVRVLLCSWKVWRTVSQMDTTIRAVRQDTVDRCYYPALLLIFFFTVLLLLAIRKTTTVILV